MNEILHTRLEKLEIIPVEIEWQPSKQPENPWVKFAGVFQDDPDFAEIAESLRKERLANDVSNLTTQLEAMANDPSIQAEIQQIEQECKITEMDGLTDL
ncbi:hypothetical protein [Okeania sp. SIO3B5]|uniref:hypothetical protein n=1 Tax=Okeania sp. SIO3B5 TaxID=2607811 RepID=UPI0025DDE3EF|nr:hypothetical protein [Okeania sp. SIO3B5]